MARLQLLKEDQKLPMKQSLSLVASASKFGLFFVGGASGFDGKNILFAIYINSVVRNYKMSKLFYNFH